MAYERTTVHLDKAEASKALDRAKKERPGWDISLSDLIRALIREYAKGEDTPRKARKEGK